MHEHACTTINPRAFFGCPCPMLRCQVMVANGLSAVPIIDGDGRFVTPISISDIRLILLTKDFPLLSTCVVVGGLLWGEGDFIEDALPRSNDGVAAMPLSCPTCVSVLRRQDSVHEKGHRTP